VSEPGARRDPSQPRIEAEEIGSMSDETKQLEGLKDSYAEKYGFNVPEHYVFKARKGLNEEVVREISWMKQEPEWMLDFRLKALRHFQERPHLLCFGRHREGQRQLG
jgi:hypothetical protein